MYKSRFSATPILVLCLFLGVICAVPSSAHPGNTDSNGGHRDVNNVSGLGPYHYHHGCPAHLHTGGVCPYNFEDHTDNTDGSPSSDHTVTHSPDSQSRVYPLPVISPSPSPTPSQPWFSVLLFPASVISFGVFLYVLSNFRAKRLAPKKYSTEKATYEALYGGHSAEELAGAPPGVEFDADGLPRESGPGPWGPSFTVYISRKGSVYHRKPNCNSAVKHAAHILRVHRSPCSKCCKHPPDLSWYERYRRIKSIKKMYHIK